jgi:membrane carboxypeptidase/penicillin-binding protein
MPLLTVQNGDYEAFRETLPPRDYFTDEIRRQLSGTFGEEEFFSGGLTIRATVDEELQAVAAAALRRGLEKYDRDQGVWRGTGKTLPAEVLGSEADWRAALATVEVPRDVASWFPAVVLEIGESVPASASKAWPKTRMAISSPPMTSPGPASARQTAPLAAARRLRVTWCRSAMWCLSAR